MTDKPLRCAAYIRVSTQEQATEGVSLAMQEARCRQAALAAGATSLEVFCDDGYSGTNPDRPALQQFLARLGEFDTLYVWKLDRLSRSVRLWSNAMHDLADAGVGFVSVSENFDFSSPLGRAALNMLATFAELFVGILRENVREALAHRARVEHRKHGRAPFGYAGGKRAGAPMAVVPAEAQIVREIFRRYAEGQPMKEIVRFLNETAASRVAVWTHTTVRNVLGNCAYIGQQSFRGDQIEALHEPLVDDATWHVAQARLRENALVPASARARTITPVYRCGLCGGAVSSLAGCAGVRYYCCSLRLLLAPAQRHQPLHVSCHKADAAVWQVVEWLCSPQADALARQRVAVVRRQGKGEARLRGLREERDELRRRLAYNLEAGAAGAVDLVTLTETNRPLQARLEKVNGELAKAGALEQAPAPLPAKSALKELRHDTVEAQRRFLLTIFERVEMLPGRRLRFVPRHPALPPLLVTLPAYWGPRRGGPLPTLEIIPEPS